MTTFWLAVFRAASRLLPDEFRRVWFAEAERDLADTLRRSRARGGGPAVWWAGAAAVADLAWRLPLEWRAARRARARSKHPFATGRDRPWIGWGRDLRMASRALARRPGYAAAAILTLGLGIGGAVAIFTAVNAVLLRPLPYPDADRVVYISHHATGLGMEELSNSPGTLRFYHEEAPFFAALAGYGRRERNLTGDVQAERVMLTAAEPSIFEVLQVQPALGRPFGPADAATGAPGVAVLTDATWRTRFGARPDILGERIDLDGVSTEIVGVMPPGFAFPDPDVIALVPIREEPRSEFGAFGTLAVARLAAGVDLDRAVALANDLQARLVEYFPDLDPSFLEQSRWSVTVERLQDRLVGREVASALWVVLATVGFLLLIACANVANLFLVRADFRQKEMAVRLALGAGSGRIAVGFLTEALLLGTAGGLLGVALAWLGLSVPMGRGLPALPRADEISLDPASLAVAAALSVVASVALGALPLLRYRGHAPAPVLRDGGRGTTWGRARGRIRSALVASQLALALLLLVGSGLMLRTFDRLRSVDPGFEGRDVLTVGLSLGQGASTQEAAAFYRRAAREVASLPGVEHVGITGLVPLGGGSANGSSLEVEDATSPEGALPPFSMFKSIAGDYAAALGVAVVAGRALTRADEEGDEAVVMVNEAFERDLLDGNAVGRAIRFASSPDSSYLRVVGVFSDVREQALRDEVRPWAYVPMASTHQGLRMDHMSLIVRTATTGAPSPAAVREAVTRLDPRVPITLMQTMDELVARSIARTSITMVLLGVAAGAALFLGAVGLFGVTSYVVGQRTREIGVRVALGAARTDITGMVFRQSAGMAAAGLGVGLVGALVATRSMQSILFEVTALDPVTFVTAPVVLLAVVALATWLPARRAARVDPIEALRAD